MTLEQLQFHTILPEILLLALLALVMLVDLLRKGAPGLVHGLSVAGLVAIAIWQGTTALGIEPMTGMNGMVVYDPMGALLKAAAALATAVTLIYGRQALADQGMGHAEFHYFALFALLGGFVMIGSAHLLTLYIGIELLSLSLYSAVALRRDSAVSTEAAMKYFVLGALASGFLLYGMSMIYGATGQLDMIGIRDALVSQQADSLVMVFGTVFLVAGLAFKLGAVPFHMWVPDVYQGAPTPTTLLLGAAPKIAGFAIVIRLLVSGLPDVSQDWQQMLLVLAVLSMALGNLVALVQTNLKRLLAYSTISHMGFMLLALGSGFVEPETGGASRAGEAIEAYGAAMFYIVTYALTTLGTFGVILMASRAGVEFDTLDDFKGLWQRHPALALVMLVMAFSLAGIPPTVGFYAKLAVLEAALTAGHVGLVIFAVMASLVGAYYYIKIVKVMFFDSPSAAVLAAPVSRPFASGLLSVNGGLVLLLGILPGGLLALCIEAVRLSLAGA